MNPIFNGINQMGNMTGFLQAFNQFRQNFQGNPQQQIQQLMNSGRITQEQYNQAVQKAQEIQMLLNGRY